MAHKVHPKGYRLGHTEDWNSRWFANKDFHKYLEEDFLIREFLEKKLKDAAVEKIEIERFPGKLLVIIYTARPGLIIGRGGKGAELLRKELEEKVLSKGPFKGEKRELKLEVREVKNPWTSAQLVAQWIAQRIEKRVPYRTVLKQALSKIMTYKNEVRGARVQVSGRLNGVTIARTEWLQEGKLPRTTMRAIIDYGFAQAYCTYGVIGVKVWIYKGEKFD